MHTTVGHDPLPYTGATTGEAMQLIWQQYPALKEIQGVLKTCRDINTAPSRAETIAHANGFAHVQGDVSLRSIRSMWTQQHPSP